MSMRYAYPAYNLHPFLILAETIPLCHIGIQIQNNLINAVQL